MKRTWYYVVFMCVFLPLAVLQITVFNFFLWTPIALVAIFASSVFAIWAIVKCVRTYKKDKWAAFIPLVFFLCVHIAWNFTYSPLKHTYEALQFKASYPKYVAVVERIMDQFPNGHSGFVNLLDDEMKGMILERDIRIEKSGEDLLIRFYYDRTPFGARAIVYSSTDKIDKEEWVVWSKRLNRNWFSVQYD